MSGFFGAILREAETLAGGVSPQTAQNLAGTVLDSAGGVQGLMAKFQAAGLGEHVQSWVGGGSNLPISAADVLKVFPADQIEAFATQHGVPTGVAAGLLAQILPHAVDAATPNGAAPAATPAATDASTDSDDSSN